VPPAAIVPFRKLRRVNVSFADMVMAPNVASCQLPDFESFIAAGGI
jgi:hypothetical protein